jgi:hypothetical protein
VALSLHRPEDIAGSSAAHSEAATSYPEKTQSPWERHGPFDRGVGVVLAVVEVAEKPSEAVTAAASFLKPQSNFMVNRGVWGPGALQCDAGDGLVVTVVCQAEKCGEHGTGMLPARGAPMDGALHPVAYGIAAS